jgi:hypothetical protein
MLLLARSTSVKEPAWTLSSALLAVVGLIVSILTCASSAASMLPALSTERYSTVFTAAVF